MTLGSALYHKQTLDCLSVTAVHKQQNAVASDSDICSDRAQVKITRLMSFNQPGEGPVLSG